MPVSAAKMCLDPLAVRSEIHYQIRHFLRLNEDVIRKFGLKPQQYWLMLAIKELSTRGKPTITAVAARLCVRHHSAVELINRATQNGLVMRGKGQADRREKFVELTEFGADLEARVSPVLAGQSIDTLRIAIVGYAVD
jgi:DNA-binding MarR family transcriptional regulator